MILISAAIAISGCASHNAIDQMTPPFATSESVSKSGSKSSPDKKDAEVIGTPSADSKFARIKPGMSMRAVSALIGAPDDLLRHETGKRWIPFYFGNDVQRMQVLYKNEGCLTYTGGNVFGGGSNELIRIEVDKKGVCWDQN
ncbi:hypothetical protein HAV38_19640 [Glaciimonas immobilis]|nr:hypothetical protein HAV38_19640 [Glaciimonas immobilis]